MFNKEMIKLGSCRSEIRELFEYGKTLALKVGEQNVFDFTLGNPAVKTPDEITKEIVNIATTDISAHAYTSAQGSILARKAIKDDVFKRFNFKLDENLIYLTCGAAASLTISLKALISSANDKVVALAPYFPEYKVFAENAGATFVYAKAQEPEFSINFESLEEIIDGSVKAVIINSPNNPSGAVYSEEEIIRLAELLNKKQKEYNSAIYLISDEPYREIVFGDYDCPYIPKYYDNTIVCYSYSKSLSLPGERIGYIALSPNCQESEDLYYAVCGAGRSQGFVCAPSLFQKVIEKCSGIFSEIKLYKENSQILVENLTKLGFSCNNPKGAFYLMLKAPNGDAKEFSNTAKELGLLLVPSNSFGVEGYVRIATCVPKDRVIRSIPAFTKLAKIYNLAL